jgi:hypothetical protein
MRLYARRLPFTKYYPLIVELLRDVSYFLRVKRILTFTTIQGTLRLVFSEGAVLIL